MKLKIKAYMSKEAFFELPSAEQRKKAEKYDVYKKYLKEGKGSAKKAEKPSKPASNSSKSLNKSTSLNAIKKTGANTGAKLVEKLSEQAKLLKEKKKAGMSKAGMKKLSESLMRAEGKAIDSILPATRSLKDLCKFLFAAQKFEPYHFEDKANGYGLDDLVASAVYDAGKHLGVKDENFVYDAIRTENESEFDECLNNYDIHVKNPAHKNKLKEYVSIVKDSGLF